MPYANEAFLTLKIASPHPTFGLSTSTNRTYFAVFFIKRRKMHEEGLSGYNTDIVLKFIG